MNKTFIIKLCLLSLIMLLWFLFIMNHVGFQKTLHLDEISDTGGHAQEKAKTQADTNRAYQESKIIQKNVIFLKLHKVGSSTLQNLFFRFADNNDLNMAIPLGLQSGINIFEYPKVFSDKYVMKSTEPFNMIAHHMRYSTDVHKVMPKGTKSITIIRNPDTQFVSAFNYFGYKNCYNGVGTIDDFAQIVVKGGQSAKWCVLPTRNMMLFDFGLESNDTINDVLVTEKVEEISANFDLVMLTEYFDESLVLMRDILNWSTEDIVYLTKIKNRKPKKKITSETIELLRKWNSGDVRLYNYFNKTFWEKVEKYGRNKLTIEVEKLRDTNKKWYDFCVKDMVPGTEIVDPEFKADYKDDTVMGYNLNDDAVDATLCRQLAMQEWPYSRKIIKRMKELKYIVN
ncbi:unnamed protein product [Owenia fusiformis]|uniref:Galactosylceramide sulfotransferase-like n=1 Tax=Owenia fusiformis TaxID=6347 RepID=A0A8S4NKM9_OWEFU|nr:unnamed protein product [Owenia fusiformis]